MSDLRERVLADLDRALARARRFNAMHVERVIGELHRGCGWTQDELDHVDSQLRDEGWVDGLAGYIEQAVDRASAQPFGVKGTTSGGLPGLGKRGK